MRDRKKMGRGDKRKKNGELRLETKKNGEIRRETEKKWGDKTQDKKNGET